MKFSTIAVEGPIGVGKTSFVNLLAKKFDAQVVLENLDNPFLKNFYEDEPGAAFQVQLFFLLLRYRQLQELSQRDLFHQVTICDYIFPKDKIFAYLNLDDSELLIYDKLYAMLEDQVPKPDLVIFLQAETRTLVERIARRNRDYEAQISETYINEVNKAYNYFFFHYAQTPLLVIDTTSIDFVHHGEHLDELVEQIRKMDRGVQYYRPLGSSA
ncbi:MAG TPA: deoxynucleoside kinase [Candidatus Polarisedimenticolaceae bacterium]|nr:deoxynucleoside kinase [Candidatus Polarisedimenticolaceae bacterium]